MSYEETILRQYSGLSKIQGLIDTFSQAVSIDDFTDEFITDVWNVMTCETYGLDVWGTIVGIGRYITASEGGNVFGFDEADDGSSDYPTPFNDGTFFDGEQETTNVRLGDDAYRTLVLAKAFSNISIATIPEINRFLSILFSGRGVAYVSSHTGMQISIKFNFALQSYEESILTNYDVIPIPSGVQLNIELISTYFGFSTDDLPFNDGVFFRGS